jgi:phosphatidylinositol alpha-mannosyltransferase
VRVAFTHPYSWPEVRRGAERILVESAISVAARGHEVTVFTAGRNAGRQAEHGVTTVKLRRHFDEPLRHERWFGSRMMPRLLWGRFDAVHSMMPYDTLAALRTRRFTGHRVVYEELGTPHRWYWQTIPDGELRRRLVSEVDVYGCVSNYSLDVLRRDWGRDGDLIPCGVRLSEFQPALTRSPAPTILFSGALDAVQKGLGDLLAACDVLLDQRPDLQLWLSGPGDPMATLATASPSLRERVTLLPLGDARALSERYATAWITALPSEGDSFGMVLIESLAAGTPIVVADDGAPPQLITPETGAVAIPHNVDSLVKALEVGLVLAENPATAGRCRAFASQFDWDLSIAPILERLYNHAA